MHRVRDGQVGHVEVGVLYRRRRWPRIADFDGLVVQREPVQVLYSLLRVLGSEEVDEGVPETRLGELVLDELAALHSPDGREEVLDVLFTHRVREIVDNEVGFGLALGVLRSRVAHRAEDWYGRHFLQLEGCFG